MLSLKTGKYKRTDYAIMLEAVDAALNSIECTTACDICAASRVCGDFTRLKAFVSSQYNHELSKRER